MGSDRNEIRAPRSEGARRVPFSYRALTTWGRIAVGLFYRRVDVTGVSRIPSDRPVILAFNHGNALGDVAVIVATMPEFPHFLASATWWKSPPARVLFRLGGVIPIHRRRDSDTEQNKMTFEACNDALANNAHLAIFPEGEMHRGPALMPLKTGAARIALGAAVDHGLVGVVIVPVGFVYEDVGRFRSRTEVHIGEPIEIDEWAARSKDDPNEAVRAVTALLADGLAAVTVNHASADERALVDRAAALALATAPEGADDDLPYARHNALRRSIASALERAGGPTSPQYRELADLVVAHDSDLAVLGVEDRAEEIDLEEPTATERSRLDAELVKLALPAGLGLLGNGPMALAAHLAGRRVPPEGWRASTKGIAGTFLSPVVWVLQAIWLSRRVGARLALMLVVAGALSGPATIAWWERWTRRREITCLERAAAEQAPALLAARASRARVGDHVRALVGELPVVVER